MDAILPFDAQLLRRYDWPGPRYTSYPTPWHFRADFGEAQLREHIRRSNADPIPRQLSLYVHIPSGLAPYSGCGRTPGIARDRTKGRTYVERVVREVGLTAGLFDRDRDVLQLHLGGGAANCLASAELGELVGSLERHFHFSSGQERDFSIEVDPWFLQEGETSVIAAFGFNRVSLNMSGVDPESQRAIDRVQTVGATLRAVEECRASGFRSIKVDVTYDLPNRDLAGLASILDSVLSVRPDRLSVSSYARPPDILEPLQQIVTGDQPSADMKLGLQRLAIEKLSAAGYHHIGMDQFALPEDSLVRAQASGTLHRNLVGYTRHADCDLVGFGVSAISHIGDSFSQNLRDLPGWERTVDEGSLPIWRGMALDADDVLRADAIQQLMCLGEIDVSGLESRFDIEFARYFAGALERLRPLVAEGLVTVDPGRLAATRRGRLVMGIIAMCFDRYLTQGGASATPAPGCSDSRGI